MAEKIVSCGLTLDEIKGLAKTVSDNKLEKIKIKNGECEIVIEGRKCPQQVIPSQTMPSMVNVTTTAASAPDAVINTAEEKVSGNVVKAPIVGTFYASPAPDKPSFVKVGDSVKKGDVIMIIESMKLMNEIQSDFDGVVTKILVEDGEAVEYDQPVMIIE